MIKVLVVDDSAVARAFLVELLGSDPAIRVVGTAADGMEAVEAVEKLRPDLVTMDIHMPRMDGQEAIREIMQTRPTPIVVVTGNEITEEVRATFASLELGALALVPRPAGPRHPEHAALSRQLVETVKLMSEVKVVRRWNRQPARVVRAAGATAGRTRRVRVVAIGASTGGPTVLKDILAALPRTFTVPVAIVQHIAPGFVDGFAAWLAEGTGRPVRVARGGEDLVAGGVYVAPDGQHLGFDLNGRVGLERGEAAGGLCPSVTHLFKSTARVFGADAAGVLLTGMGRDGADGLLALRRAGAVTIAQDAESCVVNGMPGEAVRLGAADHVLSPEKIAEMLSGLSPVAE